MAEGAQSLPQTTGGPPKRRLRNYLLVPGFQLKYTGYVVGVTLVVASALGYFAYRESKGMTDSLMISLSMQPNPPSNIEELARQEDMKILAAIVGGIFTLTLVLGVTGILVTHRLVGPAHKLKLLMGDLAKGKLKLRGGLRKGDELQDVFLALDGMVNEMRRRQAVEVEILTGAIDRARKAGTPEEVLKDLERIRDEMQGELD